MSSKVLDLTRSVLLVIDVQGKLASMMHDFQYLRHVKGLIKAAQILGLPIIATEQVPEKIGGTVQEIKEMFSDFVPIVKQTFSCCGEPRFMDELKRLARSQVIVCGIESHVCVYQTVRDLCKLGYDVHLAADSVSARSKQNSEIGIRRSEHEGAVVTSLEMFITELIRSTAHPKFREIMALLKNNG